jgi:peptidoglycan/LPS O-acetylase OafA/YrhL
LLARRVNGPRWIAGLLAAACVGGYAIAELAHGHMNRAADVPCVLAGVLAYSLRNRIRTDLIPGSKWGIFVIGLIVAYCLADLDQDRPVYWIGWLYCLVLGLSINQFADSRNRWLNRIAARVAAWSYGLYLLHVPVLYVVYDLWRPGSVTLGVLGYLAISVVAAAAAFRLIETPLMNVGRRLSEGRRS